jgi:hypothetical protein
MGQERYKQPYLKRYMAVSKTVIRFIISCKFLNLFPFFNRPLFFLVWCTVRICLHGLFVRGIEIRSGVYTDKNTYGDKVIRTEEKQKKYPLYEKIEE